MVLISEEVNLIMTYTRLPKTEIEKTLKHNSTGKKYRVACALADKELKRVRVVLNPQEKELKELVNSIEKIKKTYYSNNVKIKRIQSQSFAETLGFKIPNILSKITQKF